MKKCTFFQTSSALLPLFQLAAIKCGKFRFYPAPLVSGKEMNSEGMIEEFLTLFHTRIYGQEINSEGMREEFLTLFHNRIYGQEINSEEMREEFLTLFQTRIYGQEINSERSS